MVHVQGSGIYRPAQNCKNEYGESITIYKVTELNEYSVVEEPYLDICINKKNRQKYGMHTIHTLNFIDNYIVVDGIKWTFSPIIQWKAYLRNRRIRNNKSESKINYSGKV